MTEQQISAVVHVTADGLRQRRPTEVIIDDLIKIGVPAETAKRIFGDVKSAIQSGVQSVLIGVGSPPTDALLLAAYCHGRSAMQRATLRVKWSRLLPWAVVIFVGAIIIWQFTSRQ